MDNLSFKGHINIRQWNNLDPFEKTVKTTNAQDRLLRSVISDISVNSSKKSNVDFLIKLLEKFSGHKISRDKTMLITDTGVRITEKNPKLFEGEEFVLDLIS